MNTRLSQNEVYIDKKQLDKIVNTLFNRVIFYCYDISTDNTLSCLENHYDVSKLLNDNWYFGDTEEGRHIDNNILKNESVYEYIDILYTYKLNKYIDDIRENIIAFFSKM